MKFHTTNYQDTFIEVAEDCSAVKGEVPPLKNGQRTAAYIQFDMVSKNPYKFTSDDVLFSVYVGKNNISKQELKKAREEFFSKGQPCFRSSPLTKRYGWGVHSDHNGRIALYDRESSEYKKFASDKSLKVVKAMKTRK